MLQILSSIFSIGANSSWIYFAIAAAALVLCAEVVGIAILIKKIRAARRKQQEEEEKTDSGYAVALLALGGLVRVPEVVFAVLIGLCLLCALIFAVILIVARLKNYDFTLRSGEEKPADKPAEEPVIAEPVRDDAVERSAEVFDGEGTPEENSDGAVAAFAEQETKEEPAAESAVVPVNSAPAAAGDPAFADGTRPYKIVEKVVTETYKEVIKDAPAQNAGGRTSQDQLYDKLTDFLDYELEKRKAADAAQNADNLSAAAKADEAEDAEEEEDEDEADVELADEGELVEDDENVPDDPDHFTGSERIIGFNEETGCYIVAHYRKSFEAKLIQSRPNIKKYYSEIKNALLSYEGTKSRISWGGESFTNEKVPIVKINVRARVLELYLALDPATLEDSVYHGKDVSDVKKYEDTPFRYQFRSGRKFGWAMELIRRVCEEHGLNPIDADPVSYEEQYPFDTTDNLVARKLIKEYIREEKPATSFELAADHVPSVPQEDESVIPANANFSWEFDNDSPAKPEPEPEPEPQPAPEPEPQPEPQPAEPNVVKETVRVTQMRYTERYYADEKPVYEHVITTEEPVSSEAAQPAEPNAEPYTAVAEEAVSEEPVAEEAVEEPIEEELIDEEPIEEAPVEEEPEEAAENPYADEAESVEEPLAEEVDDAPVFRYETEEPVYEEAESEEAEEPETYAEEEPETYAEEEPAEEEPESGLASMFDEEYPEEQPAEPVYDDASYAEEEPAYAEEETPAEEDGSVYNDASYDDAPYLPEMEEEAPEGFYAEEQEGSAEEPNMQYADESQPVYDGNDADYGYYETDGAAEEPTEVHHPAKKKKVNPYVALVDVGVLEQNFPYGATVNLAALQEKGLVLPTATTLKIYATGSLSKALTVEANHFTLDALRAIDEAGGESVMVQ